MSNITRLTYLNKEIVLIGTAHVSATSVLEVRETILAESPDSICVELDQARYDSITNPNRWQEMDIKQIIKEKKVVYLLVNLILSSFQNKLAQNENIKPGQEMLEGINLSKELNASLVLADRDIRTTFLRTYRLLSFWEKTKLISSIVFSVFDTTELASEEIEKMKEQDSLEQAISEISGNYPNIKKTLVDERDQYLTYKIQNAPGNKVVAVLGAAHTIGIRKLIDTPQKIEGLDVIPPSSKIGRIIAWLIPIIILSLLIMSFIKSPTLGYQQLLTWILWNGGAAAIGCLLALAHPLTILSAFFIAPLTSLAPVVGVGWFTALLEAALIKPQVKDFENLSLDTQNLKGYFKNKVTRIFLIFLFSNLFSSIATFTSGFNILGQLIR